MKKIKCNRTFNDVCQKRQLDELPNERYLNSPRLFYTICIANIFNFINQDRTYSNVATTWY